MRLLVCPTDLVTGGASLNALDLAAQMQGRGHDVLVAAPRGELESALVARGLAFAAVESATDNRPSRRVGASLRSVTSRFRPDLVHTYEFGACLNAFFAVHLGSGTPQLSTVMSMDFPRSLPRTVPVTLGTRELVERVEAFHDAPVWLLEPPIDLGKDRVELVEPTAFVRSLDLDPAAFTVAVVSRLAHGMKYEGVRDAVLAVGDLARTDPVQMIVAGDGDATDDVRAAVASANDLAGRRAVVMTGNLDDPRVVYAAGDVVVGMGSSTIRGMAFGRPAIVVGIEGFVREVSSETFGHFDRCGFWGIGGTGDRRSELARLITALRLSPDRAGRLGQWGEQLVRQRFDLESAATNVAELYDRTRARHLGRHRVVADAVVTGLKFAPPAVRRPYTLVRDGFHRRATR